MRSTTIAMIALPSETVARDVYTLVRRLADDKSGGLSRVDRAIDSASTQEGAIEALHLAIEGLPKPKAE